MKRLITAMTLVGFLTSLSPSPKAQEQIQEERFEFIDTHMHLMIAPGKPGKPGPSRIQPGPGKRPPRRFPPKPNNENPKNTTASDTQKYLEAGKNLIAQMNKLGVDKVLLMPPPQKHGQKEKANNTYLHNLAVVQKYPTRLYLVAGGAELNPLIHGIEAKAVTQAHKEQFKQVAKKLVAAGARAFGEMSALHLAMQEKHNYSYAPPDHPLFLLLADLSAQHNLPIDLHMEAVPHSCNTPPSLAKVSHNPKTLPATVPALERLLKHNRKAKVVWQHIGWDNTGHMKPELLKKLLTDHPNLFMALRVEEKMEKARPFTPNGLVTPKGHPHQHWLDLIKAFPDRFVIGADEFIGVPNKSRRMPQSFDETWAMLKTLPKDLQKKIGGENAKAIYNLN